MIDIIFVNHFYFYIYKGIYLIMLDYLILEEKPILTKYKDNKSTKFIDLSCKTFNGVNFNNARPVLIDENYVARPDLVALAVYGDDKYGDVICKINGISNPFELNKGMVLYLPDIDEINKSLLGSQSENDLLEEYKTGRKNKKISDTTKETISKKKKNLQKLKNERRSPGDQTVEDKNYYIDKNLGIVIY